MTTNYEDYVSEAYLLLGSGYTMDEYVAKAKSMLIADITRVIMTSNVSGAIVLTIGEVTL